MEPGHPSPSTRDRLLGAAYDQLVEEGYRATTVQRVACRAGLSNGSAIYAHFGTKDALVLHAVLRHGLDSHENVRGLDDLIAHLARHMSAPPTATHRALTEVTGAATGFELEGSHLRAPVQQLQSGARRAVEEAKATGTSDRRPSTDALAAMIVDLYLGAIASKAFGRPQPSVEDVLKVLHLLVDPADGRPGRNPSTGE